MSTIRCFCANCLAVPLLTFCFFLAIAPMCLCQENASTESVDTTASVFESKNGKFKIAGEIDGFFDAQGNKVTNSTAFSTDLQVVIRKSNGTLTDKVSLNLLSETTIKLIRKQFKEIAENPSETQSLAAIAERTSPELIDKLRSLPSRLKSENNKRRATENFLDSLSREDRKNPLVKIYALAIKVDFELPAASRLKKLTKTYEDFWTAWKCYVVAELLERGGSRSVDTLRRYQEHLIQVFDTRPKGADNADIGQELVWVTDTAIQLGKLVFDDPDLVRIIENDEADDVLLSIEGSRKISEDFAKSREDFDRTSEAESKKKLAAEIRAAKSEFAEWTAELSTSWDRHEEVFESHKPKLIAVGNQLDSTLQKLSSAINSRNLALIRVNSLRNDIEVEKRKPSDERSQSTINSLQSRLSVAWHQHAYAAGVVNQLNIEVNRLGSIYNEHYWAMWDAYSEACGLVNSARNYGRLFIRKYDEAIRNDEEIQYKLGALDQEIRDLIVQLPKMPELHVAQISEKRRQVKTIATKIKFRLKDVEESVRDLITENRKPGSLLNSNAAAIVGAESTGISGRAVSFRMTRKRNAANMIIEVESNDGIDTLAVWVPPESYRVVLDKHGDDYLQSMMGATVTVFGKVYEHSLLKPYKGLSAITVESPEQLRIDVPADPPEPNEWRVGHTLSQTEGKVALVQPATSGMTFLKMDAKAGQELIIRIPTKLLDKIASVQNSKKLVGENVRVSGTLEGYSGPNPKWIAVPQVAVEDEKQLQLH